ncbi:uncharacterized protein LOC109836312 [Asparagus officinalis]|uniref:uncharacterized protein LOC109836312 n=1 Tax=Asparagus officinalis TaxID=4686 RepID=UPI00098E4B26|nr:uncharacterized protein LOC109836312 [Asparagus officinalis]
MDMEDEEELKRMCANTAVYTVVTLVTCILRMRAKRKRISNCTKQEKIRKIYCREAHFRRVLEGYQDSCQSYIRIRPRAFFKLVEVMKANGLLKDTRNVQVEEQLAMFLSIVGHKTKNRIIRTEFIRSGETVSRYFNKVLQAMNGLRDRYMKQASKEVPEEIANNSNYFPYFKDCIGLIDGTHVDAVLPSDLVARFRGRKGVTQNILAACTPNKLFTYVLAGWEGATNNYRVLQDALFRPQPYGLRVYDGKYYLCDAGYTTMPGFISPSKIECTFGILKNRFKILTAKPNYPFPTQVDIVLACTVLHNFIALEDPDDDILNENVKIDEDTGEETNEDDSNVVDYTQCRSQREDQDVRNEWKELRDQIAWAMWVDYCAKYNGGNTMVKLLGRCGWIIVQNLALDSMKPDKNFKVEAYKMAAMKINMQFRTDFTHLHVINHLKCLRNKFNDMKACLDISGAGWDETSKMITLDEETLKSWAQDKSNSKYKAYINKPLPYFKILQVIMGDDQAKGDFVRPVYANIGSSRSILIPDDDCEILEETETEPQSDACNQPRSGAVNQPQPTRYKTKSKDNMTSSSNKKNQKI